MKKELKANVKKKPSLQYLLFPLFFLYPADQIPGIHGAMQLYSYFRPIQTVKMMPLKQVIYNCIHSNKVKLHSHECRNRLNDKIK